MNISIRSTYCIGNMTFSYSQYSIEMNVLVEYDEKNQELTTV